MDRGRCARPPRVARANRLPVRRHAVGLCAGIPLAKRIRESLAQEVVRHGDATRRCRDDDTASLAAAAGLRGRVSDAVPGVPREHIGSTGVRPLKTVERSARCVAGPSLVQLVRVATAFCPHSRPAVTAGRDASIPAEYRFRAGGRNRELLPGGAAVPQLGKIASVAAYGSRARRVRKLRMLSVATSVSTSIWSASRYGKLSRSPDRAITTPS